MSTDTARLLDRFHTVLVDEIRSHRPELISSPFTVAEIYQELVPYRTHRDRLGVAMNGDYEDLLLRLLAGEGEYLILEADPVRHELRSELESPNPNTGLFREYAAATVHLNPERVPEAAVAVEALAPSEPPRDPGPGSGSGLFDPTGEPQEIQMAEAQEIQMAEAREIQMAEPEDDAAAPGGEADDEAVGGQAARPSEPPEEAGPVAGGEEENACRWCRAPLPNRENLNYCPFCGTDVKVVPCPSCGEALEPEWRFCIACGAEVIPD